MALKTTSELSIGKNVTFLCRGKFSVLLRFLKTLLKGRHVLLYEHKSPRTTENLGDVLLIFSQVMALGSHSSKGILPTVLRHCVWLETSCLRRHWHTGGCWAKRKKKKWRLTMFAALGVLITSPFCRGLYRLTNTKRFKKSKLFICLTLRLTLHEVIVHV